MRLCLSYSFTDKEIKSYSMFQNKERYLQTLDHLGARRAIENVVALVKGW